MYMSIMVVVDGSFLLKKVFDEGLKMVRLCGVWLFVVFVVDKFILFVYGGCMELVVLFDEICYYGKMIL